jgi:NAD+--asparagine ADP-ribosyltransferase
MSSKASSGKNALQDFNKVLQQIGAILSPVTRELQMKLFWIGKYGKGVSYDCA